MKSRATKFAQELFLRELLPESVNYNRVKTPCDGPSVVTEQKPEDELQKPEENE